MRVLLTVFLVLCSSAAFAQAKKFRWENETCLFESVYDGRKYTAAQLNDTRKLFHLDFFPNTIDPTPTRFEAIKKLGVETLDAEYETRTNALNRLNIVKTTYWEALRQEQLRELAQVYQLSRASILGYENPARLKDVEFAGACIEKYAEPLIKGGDDLLGAWRMRHENGLKQHGNPAALQKEFDEQLASPERMRYARIDVMTYGWWNCVNALIDRESDSSQNDREFRKMFTKTKTIECDEP